MAAVGLLAAGTACLTYSVFWYQHRLVRSNADLIALLPDGDTTRIFVDVALLRRAGLEVFSQDRLGQDAEYKTFETQTHFDYAKDLDSLAASVDGDQLRFLLRGRFDRNKLRRYAAAHHGTCSGESCRVPTSAPGRWAEFAFLQPDVLSLSVGEGRSKAAPSGQVGSRGPVSPAPVWVEFSSKLLKQPAELPLPLQIFAVSLQSARSVVLSLDGVGGNGTAGYVLKLDAEFPNRPAADTIRNQLELETKALSLALERQKHQPDPKDMTGLLASGTFRVADNQLSGQWLVRPELMRSLR